MLIGGWRGRSMRGAWARLDATCTKAAAPGAQRQAAKAERAALGHRLVFAIPGAEKLAIVKGVSFELQAGESMGLIAWSASRQINAASAAWRLAALCPAPSVLSGADIASWPRSRLGKIHRLPAAGCRTVLGTVAENIACPSEPEPQQVIAAAHAPTRTR